MERARSIAEEGRIGEKWEHLLYKLAEFNVKTSKQHNIKEETDVR